MDIPDSIAKKISRAGKLLLEIAAATDDDYCFTILVERESDGATMVIGTACENHTKVVVLNAAESIKAALDPNEIWIQPPVTN